MAKKRTNTTQNEDTSEEKKPIPAEQTEEIEGKLIEAEKPPKSNQINREILIKSLGANLTEMQFCQVFGVSENTVGRYCKKHFGESYGELRMKLGSALLIGKAKLMLFDGVMKNHKDCMYWVLNNLLPKIEKLSEEEANVNITITTAPIPAANSQDEKDEEEPAGLPEE